ADCQLPLPAGRYFTWLAAVLSVVQCMAAELPVMLVMVGPCVILTFFSDAWSIVLVCAYTIAAKSRIGNPAAIHMRFISILLPGEQELEDGAGTHSASHGLSPLLLVTALGRRST